MSPSTRRAWIEIVCFDLPAYPQGVALHPEGVDRNQNGRETQGYSNASPSTRRAWIEIFISLKNFSSQPVALHPEGVDRNQIDGDADNDLYVALHPEGVDRNIGSSEYKRLNHSSPSTRRAWIEILKNPPEYKINTGRPPPGGRG